MSIRVLVLVAAAACKPDPEPPDTTDTDGDGLLDSEEEELGSDPENPDTDGDGLADGDEVENGADPLIVDTDEDGYTDRDEVFEGSDPADPESLIYQGGWPYYFDKESIRGGFYSDPIAIGSRFARIQLTDQFGDTLDLFDFYNETRPVVIDLSAGWSTPSKNLSSWISGGDDPDANGALWPAGPKSVRQNDVYWITVLGENDQHLPATPRTASQWADAHPSKKIPVVAEKDYDTYDYCGDPTLPALVLLEPDLKLAVLDPLTIDTVLIELAARFPE